MRQLLERAQDGDRLSQAHVMKTLQSRIEKMAAYFGRQSGVDPEDLRQEAWVAVLEMLPDLDLNIGTPEQHLLKRARWRILDNIRWQRRRQHLALCDVHADSAPYLDPHSSVDLGLLQSRLTLMQRRILRGLLEGYTWREVGALVGCTSANVAYHVRRIREAYQRLENCE
jgi:RNA polymerase sigma-70 factor (ECF subfamily)